MTSAEEAWAWVQPPLQPAGRRRAGHDERIGVGLGTPDTSGGFWNRQGVPTGRRIDLGTVRARPNNQNFTIG
jgi:hypothetical protein